MKCGKCEGPVKPNIVFFGEQLPPSFYNEMMKLSSAEPDLLIVIGTALAVQPFASIVDGLTKTGCDAVLINMQNTDGSGYDFENAEKYPRRLFIKGPCDDTVMKIAKECGWEEDLKSRIKPQPKSMPDDLTN